MSPQRLLLTLVVPPALEDVLIDWLLSQSAVQEFTSQPVYGHSNRPDGLSHAEQVSARKKWIRFELHLLEQDLHMILGELKREFPNRSIHYWILPVSDTGKI
ncbi:MAG TPA: DUF3240 family protein [Methylococcus sp.]|nr:DUF3240 family protein [Methylococcus sp.]